MDEAFHRRRAWFDKGTVDPATGKPRVTCPCCGYPTLAERNWYFICELCKWEDDNQDDAEADKVWGGPNGDYSLTEARLNFQDHLDMYRLNMPPSIGERFRNKNLENDAKRQVMAGFDAMVQSTNLESVTKAWAQVHQAEAILSRELSRWVAEYDAFLTQQKQSG